MGVRAFLLAGARWPGWGRGHRSFLVLWEVIRERTPTSREGKRDPSPVSSRLFTHWSWRKPGDHSRGVTCWGSDEPPTGKIIRPRPRPPAYHSCQACL